MISELDFKRRLRAALTKAGATVSCIEPNIGSTPGVPDLFVVWANNEQWVELKVGEWFDADHVWSKYMRAEQRKWIKARYTVATEQRLLPVFVALAHPMGYFLFEWRIIESKLVSIAQMLTMTELVTLLKEKSI